MSKLSQSTCNNNHNNKELPSEVQKNSKMAKPRQPHDMKLEG
jgi:hypothetical protein